eukprot:jgi/Chlat1/8437/Chrsp80S07849
MVKNRVMFGDTDIIIFRGAIITITPEPLTHVQVRIEKAPQLLRQGTGAVLYAILFDTIEEYMTLMRRLRWELRDLELEVFRPHGADLVDIQRLYSLREDNINVRRNVVPLVDICNRLMTHESNFITKALRPYFRNLFYNASQLRDELDVLVEATSFAFDAAALTLNVAEANVQKKLAAYGAIVLLPTLFAGIYGMNFKHMPELSYQWGYLIWWIVTLTAIALLLGLFRFIRWI